VVAGVVFTLSLGALFYFYGRPGPDAGEAIGRLIMSCLVPAFITGYCANRSSTPWAWWRIVVMYLGALVVISLLQALGNGGFNALPNGHTPPTPNPTSRLPNPPTATIPAYPDANNALATAYISTMMQAIKANWMSSDDTPALPCQVRITQRPGGYVDQIDIEPSCPYSTAAKDAIVAAVRRANPLPYKGFENVFKSTIVITFNTQREPAQARSLSQPH